MLPRCSLCNCLLKVAYIRVSDPKPSWARRGWYCPRCDVFEKAEKYDFLPKRKGKFRSYKPKNVQGSEFNWKKRNYLGDVRNRHFTCILTFYCLSSKQSFGCFFSSSRFRILIRLGLTFVSCFLRASTFSMSCEEITISLTSGSSAIKRSVV